MRGRAGVGVLPHNVLAEWIDRFPHRRAPRVDLPRKREGKTTAPVRLAHYSKGRTMQKVLVENNADGTTLITINRPERRNAICAETALMLQKSVSGFRALQYAEGRGAHRSRERSVFRRRGYRQFSGTLALHSHRRL